MTPTKSNSHKMPDATAMDASSTTKPPAKKKRLTTEEKAARDKELADKKEAKEKEMADKKREREEQAVKKAAEKVKQEEEKAARAREREEKRKLREEDDRQKAEQRDEKKRKKEEEQKRVQEEKEKKERSQPKLNAFFMRPSTSKSESQATPVAASPSKGKTRSLDVDVKGPETEYTRLFRPFYLRENTRLASPATHMDEETREAKSKILDEFLSGRRSAPECGTPFNSIELLSLPAKPRRRGRLHCSVRAIMEAAEGGNEKSDALGSVPSEAGPQLAAITMKVIAFSQDVRPPYYGTVTHKPYMVGCDGMRRLARQPARRSLPLDYDYDSEAEWQEEEGEDLDVDEDEEELEDEDDMDGFLDDSEDAGLSRRVFGTTIEPESTGICFENSDRIGPNPSTYTNKMEFMHGKQKRPDTMHYTVANIDKDGLGKSWGIDPFSSQYWEPEPKTKTNKTAQSSGEKTLKMPPPPAPANAFSALTGATSGGGASGAVKMVKSELLDDVKRAILDNKALSKVGIIDFIFHQFRDNVSRMEVKNTVEHVAEKKGSGRTKEWDLKPGHEIES